MDSSRDHRIEPPQTFLDLPDGSWVEILFEGSRGAVYGFGKILFVPYVDVAVIEWWDGKILVENSFLRTQVRPLVPTKEQEAIWILVEIMR